MNTPSSEPKMVTNCTLWDGSLYFGWTRKKFGTYLPDGEGGSREYSISNHPLIGGKMQVQERGRYHDGNLIFGTRTLAGLDISAHGSFHREGYFLDGYRVVGDGYTIVKGGSDHSGLTHLVQEYREKFNGFKIAKSVITEEYSKEEGENLTRILGEGLGLIFFAVIQGDFPTARRLKKEMIKKLESVKVQRLRYSARYDLETKGFFLDEQLEKFIDDYLLIVDMNTQSSGVGVSRIAIDTKYKIASIHTR